MKYILPILLLILLTTLTSCPDKADCNRQQCSGFAKVDYLFPILYQLQSKETFTNTYTDSASKNTLSLTFNKNFTTNDTTAYKVRCDNPIDICIDIMNVQIIKDSASVKKTFGNIYYQKCNTQCPLAYQVLWNDSTTYFYDDHRGYNNDTTLYLHSGFTPDSLIVIYYSRFQTNWSDITDTNITNYYDNFYYVEAVKTFATYAEQAKGTKYNTTNRPYLYMNFYNGVFCYGDKKKKTKYYLKR
ncbi:MAG: hypothetical protein NW207_03075 [Cytophagales bacterium]|nr:hypothetical protein [Cytophagales bacterium]